MTFLLGAKLTPVLLLCYPILNIHLPFHDLGAIPALLSPQLESSQWKEGSGEKRETILLPSWDMTQVARVTSCLHPIGQNLVTWFRHTREVGKCSPYSGYPFAQLKLRTLLLKQEEEMDIGCPADSLCHPLLRVSESGACVFPFPGPPPNKGGNSASWYLVLYKT